MEKLELIVFNVGHGLSVAFIERPECYVTLIDLGARTGFTPLKELRLQFGVRPDVLYITHPHGDHLMDVETALSPDFRPDGINFQTYDWADVKKREQPSLAEKIDQFQQLIRIVPYRVYGGHAKLVSLAYAPDNAKKSFGEASYVNNSSQMVIYTWKEFKIAVFGDQEKDCIQSFVNATNVQAEAKEASILIPSHHGHKNGFAAGWVQKFGKPSLSIISVQSRDPNVDPRYNSPDFAHGVSIGGETRYALTTRSDGNILGSMWHDHGGTPFWSFDFF